MVKVKETREDEGAHSEVELGVGVQVALEKARQGNAMQWIWHHDGSVGFVKCILYHIEIYSSWSGGWSSLADGGTATSYNRWKHGTEESRYAQGQEEDLP